VSVTNSSGHTALALALRAAMIRADDDAESLLLRIATDLVSCGASAKDLCDAPAADELFGWVDKPGREHWALLLAKAVAEEEDGPRIEMATNEVGHSLPITAATLLSWGSLRSARHDPSRRWMILCACGKKQSRPLHKLATAMASVLSEAERAHLASPQSPPKGSAALFWHLAGTLSDSQGISALTLAENATRELLSALSSTDVQTAARVERETQLNELQQLVALHDEHNLDNLRKLVSPPARCRYINMQDSGGGFALRHAVAAGNHAAVSILLAGSANPNIRSILGSALQLATENGDAAICATLCAAGAIATVDESEGEASLHQCPRSETPTESEVVAARVRQVSPLVGEKVLVCANDRLDKNSEACPSPVESVSSTLQVAARHETTIEYNEELESLNREIIRMFEALLTKN